MGDRRHDRDPPKTKRLSLTRDGRNAYGESVKAARTDMPRFKRAPVRSERREAAAVLGGMAGPVRETGAGMDDRAERAVAEATVRGAHPERTKVPDIRPGDLIAQRLDLRTRRTSRRQGSKARIVAAAAATVGKVDET